MMNFINIEYNTGNSSRNRRHSAHTVNGILPTIARTMDGAAMRELNRARSRDREREREQFPPAVPIILGLYTMRAE